MDRNNYNEKLGITEQVNKTGLNDAEMPRCSMVTIGADNKFYEANSSPYNSYIGSGISSFLPALIADTCTESGEADGLKVAIVTGENVASLWK